MTDTQLFLLSLPLSFPSFLLYNLKEIRKYWVQLELVDRVMLAFFRLWNQSRYLNWESGQTECSGALVTLPIVTSHSPGQGN